MSTHTNVMSQQALRRMQVNFAGYVLDTLFDAITGGMSSPVRLGTVAEMVKDCRKDASAAIVLRAGHLGRLIRGAASCALDEAGSEASGCYALSRMSSDLACKAMMAVATAPGSDPKDPAANPMIDYGYLVEVLPDEVKGAHIRIRRI